jgi:hypothetical protein
MDNQKNFQELFILHKRETHLIPPLLRATQSRAEPREQTDTDETS